jgi:hypothetical protein
MSYYESRASCHYSQVRDTDLRVSCFETDSMSCIAHKAAVTQYRDGQGVAALLDTHSALTIFVGWNN